MTILLPDHGVSSIKGRSLQTMHPEVGICFGYGQPTLGKLQMSTGVLERLQDNIIYVKYLTKKVFIIFSENRYFLTKKKYSKIRFK